MSVGDISGNSDYYSTDEIGQLSNSYREMQIILLEQVEQAKRVARGDFESELTPRSDKDELTIALNEMIKQPIINAFIRLKELAL